MKNNIEKKKNDNTVNNTELDKNDNTVNNTELDKNDNTVNNTELDKNDNTVNNTELDKNDINNSLSINKHKKKYTIEYFKEKNDILKIKILELQNKIKKIRQKILDLKLYSQSEIENMRRRSILDIENAYKFSLEKFIYELLPVIDNLERSLDLKIHKEENSLKVSIIEGIKLTLQLLIILIKKFGVTIINEINVPFNPSKHQAMSIVESDKIKENYIIKILQKGYFLHKRLLRPAMVIVSKIKENINN
ncbi:nucleotide exchange factor GrpE [Enterobacteriaceae endosymbiont of Donacia crassipes]|uniref:nucleotide exchange factor GrpE n=1 Tax=Enterobacteriaceae endosymbiont of Donacia crassipes TaxID=2675776 RepID=UPI001449F286|nr:nucleotide exchange factor GrpE [Enterobacteriaceae endosymbiont of Donacia crassipes]QJC34668.1 nucleotide exchange factor GrpE [Enterobacteriaceae endosymbiont of Donacia crassipes]